MTCLHFWVLGFVWSITVYSGAPQALDWNKRVRKASARVPVDIPARSRSTDAGR
jgi:hypothetical protein